MTDQEIIKAIAELDGWSLVDCKIQEWSNIEQAYVYVTKQLFQRQLDVCLQRINEFNLPPYLTSRDAIIPVIEKQTWPVRAMTIEHIVDRNCKGVLIIEEAIKCLIATPRQLCEALLRATNKWIE